MPRKAADPQAGSGRSRHWRYLDEIARVLAHVRRADGSTLLAHPNGVYELHPDHDSDPEFSHPLLAETDAPAFDPVAVTADPEPVDPPTDPKPDPGAGDTQES